MRFKTLRLLSIIFFTLIQVANAQSCPLETPPVPQNYGNYNPADFKSLNSTALSNYLRSYKQNRGREFSPKVFRLNIYNQGFFLHESGIFITALHVIGNDIRWSITSGETFIAGRDGPPIKYNHVEDLEIYYIGSASSVYSDEFGYDYRFGCFDCLPFDSRDEVVIGKLLSNVPDEIETIEIAETYPQIGSTVFASGKPQSIPGIPQGEVRGTLGKLKYVYGNSIVISNKLVPGFSGGPILDHEGKAIATSVTIVNHFDKKSNDFPELNSKRPSCWKEDWGVGSDLVSLKPIIDDIISRYGSN